jgi:hypothetical protein
MPMPKPREGEKEQDFVGRVMSDEVMLSEYPDEKQRAAVAFSQFRRRENSLDDGGWPMICKCRFIEPGLVAYADIGTVLVKKEILDKMAASFVGKPVINEVHKDVEPGVYKNGKADGIVTNVWFEQDGWYWADFLVWDESTKRNISSDAYSVSCAYDVTGHNQNGGLHNSIPYEGEFLDGQYTHLAVVENPRYEGARIVVLNSKEGGGMKFKFWKLFKKEGKEVRNAGETDGDKTVQVDGQAIPLKMLVDCWKAEEAEKAKKSELEAQGALPEDAVVEIDGKETSVKNLCDNFKSVQARKNAEDEEAKKKKADEEAKNVADEEAKKKAEEEERKNADEKAAKEKEEAEKKTAENSLDEELKKAAALRGSPQQPTIVSRREQVAEGTRKYGPSK